TAEDRTPANARALPPHHSTWSMPPSAGGVVASERSWCGAVAGLAMVVASLIELPIPGKADARGTSIQGTDTAQSGQHARNCGRQLAHVAHRNRRARRPADPGDVRHAPRRSDGTGQAARGGEGDGTGPARQAPTAGH